MVNVQVLFGGPSAERGVSINSARSVSDHLNASDWSAHFTYVTPELELVSADRWMLYQNTPDDFDFRIKAGEFPACPLDGFQELLGDCDIVLPIGHGEFFEDGKIQTLLSNHNIPFLGTTAGAAQRSFDKCRALDRLAECGLQENPRIIVRHSNIDSVESSLPLLDSQSQTYVVKPSRSGSSIGVMPCQGAEEVRSASEQLLARGFDTLLVEPDHKQRGFQEFTVIVIENEEGRPVALIPTGIECDGIFTYRMKYLATNASRLRMPCTQKYDQLQRVRSKAEEVFKCLEMRDFGRIDGWLNETTGEIIFSDFNVISGLEQNSFFFIQAAYCGMSHKQVLQLILQNSCRRQGIESPVPVANRNDLRPVRVCFGGITSERQVSVQSGTNVWLKLLSSSTYSPSPCLLDRESDESDYRVTDLPYYACLFHTVEDIRDAVENNATRDPDFRNIQAEVSRRLDISDGVPESPEFRQRTLEEFIQECKDDNLFVFLALHGGDGENGVVQARLDDATVSYNCAGPAVSATCSDKITTNVFVDALKLNGVSTAKRVVLEWSNLAGRDHTWLENSWQHWVADLQCSHPVLKPATDGCSTGVVHLASCQELLMLLHAMRDHASTIDANRFVHHRSGGARTIELPTSIPERLILEEYIETNDIQVRDMQLLWSTESDWVECTIGVYEKEKTLHVMQPTVTVRSGDILALEEKFQAGTGINFTPPPAQYVSPDVLFRARSLIGRLTQSIGINGFARIDAFLNYQTGDLKIIEVNTLPGMTPATAIFHQGLAAKILPCDFLELAIAAGYERTRNLNTWCVS